MAAAKNKMQDMNRTHMRRGIKENDRQKGNKNILFDHLSYDQWET
jgi:hypothetical protein